MKCLLCLLVLVGLVSVVSAQSQVTEHGGGGNITSNWTVTWYAKWTRLSYDHSAAKWNYSLIMGGVWVNSSGASTVTSVRIGSISPTVTPQGGYYKLSPGSTYVIPYYQIYAGSSWYTAPAAGAMEVVVPPAPPPQRSFTVVVRNTSNSWARYNIYQDGKIIGQQDLAPGEAVAKQVITYSDSPVTVGEIIAGSSSVEGEIVYGPPGSSVFVGNEPVTIVGEAIPSAASAGGGAVPVDVTPSMPRPPEGAGPAGSTQTTSSPGGVYRTQIRNTDSTLTADLYREGQKVVGDVVWAASEDIVRAIKSLGGGGGGGGNVDTAPIVAAETATKSAVEAQTAAQAAKLDQIAANTANTNNSVAALGAKLDEIAANTADGGGGGGTDVSGIESRLDTANEHLDEMTKQKKADALEWSNPTSKASALVSELLDAASQIEYEGKRPGGLATNVGEFSGGTSAWGTYKVGTETIVFGTQLHSPLGETQGLMLAARPILLIAMMIGFLRSISGHVTTYTASLPQVNAQPSNMGTENVVPVVAHAKHLATAAASVTATFAACAAIVALADTGLTYFGGGIETIFTALNVPGSGVIGFLDSYVPLAPGLALTIMSASAPYLMAPIFLTAAGVLKFLKA